MPLPSMKAAPIHSCKFHWSTAKWESKKGAHLSLDPCPYPWINPFAPEAESGKKLPPKLRGCSLRAPPPPGMPRDRPHGQTAGSDRGLAPSKSQRWKKLRSDRGRVRLEQKLIYVDCERKTQERVQKKGCLIGWCALEKGGPWKRGALGKGGNACIYICNGGMYKHLIAV